MLLSFVAWSFDYGSLSNFCSERLDFALLLKNQNSIRENKFAIQSFIYLIYKLHFLSKSKIKFDSHSNRLHATCLFHINKLQFKLVQ